MYNWKDARNYRRFRDENGNVIVNIIYVDGEEVAVSDEVYEAYASMDRRERYLEEREGAEKPLSFEMLLEEGYTEDALCSAENLEDTISDKLLYRKLKTVLGNLDTADQEMIRTVFLTEFPCGNTQSGLVCIREQLFTGWSGFENAAK